MNKIASLTQTDWTYQLIKKIIINLFKSCSNKSTEVLTKVERNRSIELHRENKNTHTFLKVRWFWQSTKIIQWKKKSQQIML